MLQPDLALHASTIPQNLARLRERVAEAAVRSGRSPDEVALLAATKSVNPRLINLALDDGIRLVGENRVQEAASKIPEVGAGPGVEWHFIGSLQRNKARQAAALFDVIQSIDSIRLAETLDRISSDLGRKTHVLLEVNTTDESSKHGFSPDELLGSMDAILSFGDLRIEGMMTIGPLTMDADRSRRAFRSLSALRDNLSRRYPDMKLQVLSMGMSEDFEIAIEEGSTLIRLGRAIFGPRS